MKNILIFLLVILTNQNTLHTSKILIIYFSRTGNTELFTKYIQENENISSFKIDPVTPYPEDYNTMLDLAKKERNEDARPDIKDPLTDISKYDIILLGYPIWHSHLPNIVINQLEKLNFDNKTIYPFNTHGGSKKGDSIEDIKNAVSKNANVKDGFPIKDTDIKNNKADSVEKIKDWLDDIANSFKYIKFNYSIFIVLLLIFYK